MLFYDDVDIDLRNFEDKRYDAEKVSAFIDDLAQDIDEYTAKARVLVSGYGKYYHNETFAGSAADSSKEFIANGQMDKLHVQNHNIQKELYKTCLDVKGAFESMVDPSSKARIDREVLRQIEKDHKNRKEELDMVGYEIEFKVRETISEFSDLTDFEYFDANPVREIYDEFCGNGGFVEKCIRKLEWFDEHAKTIMDQAAIEDKSELLQNNIRNIAGALDAMKVYNPSISKKSLGLASASINSINPFATLNNSKVPNYLNVYGMRLNLHNGKSTDDYIYVDDSKRVKIGTVNDAFITVTGVPDGKGGKTTTYGGAQAWLKDFPGDGKIYSDYGCGIIASVNQYIYLTGQTTITYEEYRNLAYKFLNAEDQPAARRDTHIEVRKQAIKGPISGALPGQMSTYISTMCEKKGVNISSKWDYVQDYESDYDNMKEQLNKGVPVIWAVNDFGGDKVPFHEYDSTTGTYIHHPKDNDPIKVKGGGASSHYVVATGIYEDYDDNGEKRRMIEISSWGEKYYVDYDQYIKVVSDNPLNQPFSSVFTTEIK